MFQSSSELALIN